MPAARDADQGRLRGGKRRRRPDVRRRGARGRRGPPGAAVRRSRRAAAERDAGGDRALARGRLHRQRPEEPAAGQPRSAAEGDRGLPALPLRAGAADRADASSARWATSPPSCSPATRPGSPGCGARRRCTSSAAARSSSCRSSIRRRRCARRRSRRRCAGTSRRCPTCSRGPSGSRRRARGGASAERARAAARALRRPTRLLWLRRRTERSAAETEALGAQLAAQLEPGDVVVVSGEVGAGKTTLIRGACRALGIEGPVTSPTFTIGHRYAGGRLPVSHLDLYRLDGPRRRGTGAARRLPRPRLGRFRRVAGGGRAAAVRLSDRARAPRPRRRRQPRDRACPPHPAANRRVSRGTVHVASNPNLFLRTEGRLMKGLKTLAAVLLGSRCWWARRRRRRARPRSSTTWPAASPRTRNRRTNARRKPRRAPSSKASKATSTTAFASSSRLAKTSAPKAQPATQGTLYVNKITSNIPGKHRVTWFVEGKRIGSFAFTITG